MKFIILTLIQLAACLTLTISGFIALRDSRPLLTADQEQKSEVLYLPNGKALQFISFGFRNMFSNLLWFNAVNYFGKHYRSDQNYMWLYHMADLVTTLDPHAIYAYDFVSTMLSWEAGKPDQAVALLSKAIEAFPNNWRFYYLRGFTFMYFLHEPENAQKDFASASQLPNAHPIVTRLASKVLAFQDGAEAAIDFLRNALITVREQSARAALEERLREAYLELDLKRISQAVEMFKAKTSRAPADIQELVSSGIISSLPLDPFGGMYYIDSENGELKTTSNRSTLSNSLRVKRDQNEESSK